MRRAMCACTRMPSSPVRQIKLPEESAMPRRKIKRRSGEGISISGPATVHVSRRVLLIVDAPREAHVARPGDSRRAIECPRRRKISFRLAATKDQFQEAGRKRRGDSGKNGPYGSVSVHGKFLSQPLRRDLFQLARPARKTP